MLFRDLYKIVSEEIAEPHVRFGFLKRVINMHHAGVGEVKVWAVKYPIPNHQAHYILLGKDRTSPYEEEFDIAEIRYCEALDQHPEMLRFALTKELMHVFDSEEEKTDTREKFIKLAREIQNQPLPKDASAMFNAELGTKWMAVVILCPKPFRDMFLRDYLAGNLQGFEIAERLRLPEWLIPHVMDDYYEVAFDAVMRKS